MKKSERAVACTFSKRAIGIQAQRVFKIKTGMSECVYMGGRELVPHCVHTNGHGKDIGIEDMLYPCDTVSPHEIHVSEDYS